MYPAELVKPMREDLTNVPLPMHVLEQDKVYKMQNVQIILLLFLQVLIEKQ